MIHRRSFLHGALAAMLAPSALRAAPARSTALIDFDPTKAKGLRIIEKAWPLSKAQRGRLRENGFVILNNRQMYSFGTAYEQLYYHDVPLFVSADSMMHALHRSFDDILKEIELISLIPALRQILGAMRQDLSRGVLEGMDAETIQHVDLYLAVAASLLEGAPSPLLAGGKQEDLDALLAGADAASGITDVLLFGALRMVDFSQFKPRGHYTDTVALQQYFRAMMWLGRIDFRLIEQTQEGPVFHRTQFDAAVGLRLLMDQPTHEQWLILDRTIGAFVGPYDSMEPRQLDDVMAALSITDARSLVAVQDADARAAVEAVPDAEQRILSHLVVNDTGSTLPLSRTFLLLGQRYTIDSHALSDLVYDRVGRGKIKRMMPDPLDVAYTVFENDRALSLLASERRIYGYDQDLAQVRERTAAREDWQSTLYDAWLNALRALSTEQAEMESLPTVARTEAWQRRILNTQLASWAELRRDTILYAKQSYTSMILCEHPDAYVDPYPKFYDAIVRYARLGEQIVRDLKVEEINNGRVLGHFQKLAEASETLGDIARRQRDGERISKTHLAFINDVVRSVTEGCGGLTGAEGWYPELFLEPIRSMEYDPVIADVHTQPTDADGAVVGRVLHVATGVPRLMLVTVETCDGPRAYLGVVSTYHEHITGDFERLNDAEWAGKVQEAEVEDWMADLYAD